MTGHKVWLAKEELDELKGTIIEKIKSHTWVKPITETGSFIENASKRQK